MALTASDCQAMIDACASNNVKLGIAYYRHFYPAVMRAKELVAGGELGKISTVQINAFEWNGLEPNESRSWAPSPPEPPSSPRKGFY
jgi:predicted dehydrogenase